MITSPAICSRYIKSLDDIELFLELEAIDKTTIQTIIQAHQKHVCCSMPYQHLQQQAFWSASSWRYQASEGCIGGHNCNSLTLFTELNSQCPLDWQQNMMIIYV